MKNLLVIAYYFPPSGGPGVQRVLKHVQYLREFGWNPIVLTVENGTFPARDESLLSKIPSDVRVERTHIYEPYDLYKFFTGEKASTGIDVSVLSNEHGSWKKQLAQWIRGTFFIPDARIGWLPTAIARGKELIQSAGIDAIYSSSPPYTCSLIGRALHRHSGLPWIAGLRDPWTGFLTTPDRWWLPAMIDKHLEKSVLQTADYVECAWQGIINDARRKYPKLPENKFLHIPNGFDSADFPDMSNDKLQQEESLQPTKRLIITYSGSLYGLRNPDTLLYAMEELVAEGECTADEILLRCVGRVGDEIKKRFEDSTISMSIEIVSYVPHEESIRYLFRSSALLLIVDSAKESNEIVPGKVYEYIGSMKPVIAIAPPDSAVAQLLRETQSGFTVEYNDIASCKSILKTMLARWRNNEKLYEPNTEEIQQYERRSSAKKLASVLDTLISNTTSTK